MKVFSFKHCNTRRSGVIAGTVCCCFLLVFCPVGAHAALQCVPASQPENASWEAVPLRTANQVSAGVEGGEGMQMPRGISYAPSDPKIVYMVTDVSQVWKSIDGGRTWRMKNNGFAASGGISLAVHPDDPDMVLVAGARHAKSQNVVPVADGIYRTLDGGDSWTLIRRTNFHRLGNKKGGINFAFSGRQIYAGTHEEGLLKSISNGDSWMALNVLTSERILDVKVRPTPNANGDTVLFVATDASLYQVIDQGNGPVVRDIGATLPQNPAHHPRAVVIGPDELPIVSVGAAGVYRSIRVNGNYEFFEANLGLPINGSVAATYLAISPLNSNKLYVSLLERGGNQPYYTKNVKADGFRWYAPREMDSTNMLHQLLGKKGGAYFSGPIAPHPGDEQLGRGNVALATANSMHPEVTNDGGETWEYSSSGFSGGRVGQGTTSFAWDPHDPRRFAFFLIDFGPVLTTDGGATFRRVPVAAHGGFRTTQVGALEPRAGSQKMVTAVGTWETRSVNGVDVPPVQVLEVSDDGVGWSKIKDTTGHWAEANFKFIAFHPTAIDPGTNEYNVIYAGKYRSDDGGDNWRPLDKTIVAMYPGNGDIVYAKETHAQKGVVIYKSTTRGDRWDVSYPPQVMGNETQEVVVHPRDPDRIYVASSRGIYAWNSHLGRWEMLGREGFDVDCFGRLRVRNLAIDPLHPNVIYAGRSTTMLGHANGVFRSVNGGRTWKNITGSLGAQFTPWALSVNPHNGYIYMGSSHGTWRLAPPYQDDDGDGILADGDWSGSATDNYCRNGNTVDCDDNCPVNHNPRQSDRDGDGRGNVCDPMQTRLTSVAAEDGWVLGAGGIGADADSRGAGRYALRIGDHASGQQYRAIVSFDTASIPRQGRVVGARLELTRGGVIGNDNPYTSFGPAQVDLSIAGFAGDPALQHVDFQAVGAINGLTGLKDDGRRAVMDLGGLPLVGMALQNADKVQLRIKFAQSTNRDNGYDYIGYYSGDNIENAPQLVVDYTLPD